MQPRWKDERPGGHDLLLEQSRAFSAPMISCLLVKAPGEATDGLGRCGTAFIRKWATISGAQDDCAKLGRQGLRPNGRGNKRKRKPRTNARSEGAATSAWVAIQAIRPSSSAGACRAIAELPGDPN